MGVVDLAEKTAGIIPKPSSELSNATGWIKDAIGVINSLNQLITTVNNNPLMQRFKNPQGSQIIMSDPGAKAVKNITPAPAPTSAVDQRQPTDKDMQSYFSTPEGIKTIVQTIDQFAPLLDKGLDTPLKDVKELLNLAIDQNAEKPAQQSKTEKSKKPKSKGKTKK